MIGLDTNVLVRYIMQDDPKQSSTATRLIEALTGESPGFVPIVTLVELVWVLESSYGLDRMEVAAVLERLLRSKEITLDRAELLLPALRAFRAGSADFADCLIARIAQAAGCAETVTFDLRAAKTAGMRALV